MSSSQISSTWFLLTTWVAKRKEALEGEGKSSIRLGTSPGNWDPVPWPNFRCLRKKKYRSPRHCDGMDGPCGISDSPVPSPWSFSFTAFTDTNLAALQVKVPKHSLSSVSPSQSTLRLSCHSVCFSSLIYDCYDSFSKNSPTSSDVNVA